MAVFSKIQKSQLEGAKRLDAEYYQPEYLDVEKKLNSLETKTIEEISKSVVSFGAYSLTSYIEWQESGVLYVNVGDIHDGYIDTNDIKHISPEVDEILKKSRVTNGQVLLTMAGTIGNAAVAHDLKHHMNANQAIAKITPTGVSPYYLAAFLNSKYGLLQTRREIVSSVQANIFLGPIKKFKVPLFEKKSTTEIENKYRDFLATLENSQSLYSQAEKVLLEELGLTDFEANRELWNIANLSEIKVAGRMDAEYFQPKYEKLLKKLNNKTSRLGEIAHKTKKRPNVDLSNEYHYSEISDVNTGSAEIISNTVIGRELPANANTQVKGGELVVSKVRPTRGAVAIIPETWKKNHIVSGAFTVFRVDSPMREYLLVVLRSLIGKLQMEKPTTGTSYPTITDTDVENILIPILSEKTQQKIAELVRQSHTARAEAKRLLESAKLKVEELIEAESH